MRPANLLDMDQQALASSYRMRNSDITCAAGNVHDVINIWVEPPSLNISEIKFRTGQRQPDRWACSAGMLGQPSPVSLPELSPAPYSSAVVTFARIALSLTSLHSRPRFQSKVSTGGA